MLVSAGRCLVATLILCVVGLLPLVVPMTLKICLFLLKYHSSTTSEAYHHAQLTA